MKASLVAATLVAAALALSSRGARAAGHASGFGEKGQLILTADRLMPLVGYTHSSVETTTNLNTGATRSTAFSGSSISLLAGREISSPDGANNQPVDPHAIPRVALDFTIINNLTLGAGLAFAFGLGGSYKIETVTGPNTTTTTRVDAPTLTAIGLAPRIGYIIPFGEHLAFWPRLGFAFYSVSGELTPPNVNTRIKVTDTTFSLDLDPQLVIIPTEHFFLTVGPLLNVPIGGGRTTSATTGATTQETNQDTTILHFGINVGIGGWLDL